ncbi:CMP-N-acetylneuraminate-beta-galactosamide-alpha-2,3-sialyltransferase 1-like [Brachyhypopomus gauderio]|uniref:CMP-N-acetylneuraminate-beta-galactosamide- alpha-2,3-sialyltransferase 1-like n=1 Tax=Brachyhypopomus gauderio TaxID=698409 RepID=UPI0040420611
MILRKRLQFLTAVLCVLLVAMYLFSLSHREPSLLGPVLTATHKSCACESCIVGHENDTWFYKKFNPLVQPLLNKNNRDISNETYSWWMWLQMEDNPSSLPVVLNRLFQTISAKENYMDAGPSRCRTCALVGNSGNLRSSRYGKLIDSNDFVIRINKAPTQGFEEDVGSRTTHHVMYPESAIDLNETTTLLLVPFKILDLEWIVSALSTGNITSTYQPVQSRIKTNKDKVLVFSPTFMRYVHASWLDDNGRYPSTGFLSLVFALHICDKVNVFGFGADHRGNWHHYWEDNLGSAFRETGVHDADQEQNITRILAKKGKVTLFKGVSWSSFKWEE